MKKFILRNNDNLILMVYYNKDIKDVLSSLNSSRTGLKEDEAKKRITEFGANELTKANKISIAEMIVRQFLDLMVLILIIAAVIDFLNGDAVEGTVITGIVILNAIIGFIMEFKAEKSLEMLKKMMAPQARVMRDKREFLIEAKDLVPGDIIVLEEGISIPADARVFEESELFTDEAPLTGESTPQSKHSYALKKENCIPADQDNMIFMGTNVTHGSGKAIVTSTGMNTEFGKIAKLSSQVKKEKSPLQKEMLHMGKLVGKVTFVICLLVVGLGVLQGREIFEMFKIAISLAVAAVPEGLPATITIALAIGVQRMVRKNAIIRKLSSVETLGCTSVICSDKTGTLTKNEMTVKKMFANGKMVEVTGSGYVTQGDFLTNGKKLSSPMIRALDNLFRAMHLCNNAKIEDGVVGDPTEIALLVGCRKAGFVKATRFERVDEIPFDSTRKMMTTIHKMPKDSKGNTRVAYVKGAPTLVLELCSKMMVNGKLVRLSTAKRKELKRIKTNMENNALRVLALAYKPIKRYEKKDHNKKLAETDLVLLGLVGMIDPPREGVKDAVALCKKAGIKTFVITGDSGLTAKAIAKQVGMADEKTEVITGEEINEMKDVTLRKRLGSNVIFARVTPEHKMRIVSLLEAAGHVVAVTGDGVNDAPALKKASIGVAMGAGTDVSKNASNMVLTDNSFASIVGAVKEGRTIYDNIKKFTLYIFSSNIGELFTVFFGMMMGFPLPLLAVQILAIDLGTDVLPSLALGVEPSEKDIMQRRPRNIKDKIMNKHLLFRLVIIGIVIAVGTLSLFAYTLFKGGYSFGDVVDPNSYEYMKATTLAFVTLIIFQMFNVFNSRSEKESVFKMDLFSNKFLLGSVMMSVILCISLVYLPLFQEMFKTVALSAMDWVWIVVISSSVLVVDEIRKVFVR